MYLEKLEIQGFKSFANKNKLIFPGLVDGEKRGLTAIVGPNGSGKSNVADSVRWALGEQSLKTLRGKKSEDVIFSGSDQKNQLGLAEVSLHLNNSAAVKRGEDSPQAVETESDLDQILRSSPEIVITRRLYRSGESEYILNNSRARLSDIQMLLAKANFGQKTYSVIGQGMVENFLNTSAAERKDFFDEATGVKQFQIKRDASLNKLESSYENLEQADMLLLEIKPRLRSLTRQVEKLNKRSQLENELRTSQLNYYHKSWEEISGKLDDLNGQYLEREKIKLDKDKKFTKLNDELNKIKSTDYNQAIGELKPRLLELNNAKNSLLKQLAKIQAELEVNWEAQGQFDLSWLSGKQGELTAELEKNDHELSVLKNDRGREKEKELADELARLDKAMAAAQAELKSAGDALPKNRRAEKTRREINQIILDFLKRLEELGALEDLNELKTRLSAAREEFKDEISDLLTEENAAKLETIKDLQAKIIDLNEARRNATDELNACRLELSGKNERQKILAEKKRQIENDLNDIKNKLSQKTAPDKSGDASQAKSELNSKISALDKQILALEAELAELNKAGDEEKSVIFAHQKNLQNLQTEITALNGELSAIKINAAREETRLEDLENNIRQAGLDLGEIKKHAAPADDLEPEKALKRINDLKNQLEMIGGIDPETEKEYRETKERYDFLSAQTDDLDKAIKSLEEIIYELDLNIKNRFDAEFKIISEKFNDYFKILFNGGSSKIFKIMIADLEKEEEAKAAAKAAETAPNGQSNGQMSAGLTAAEASVKNATEDKLKKIKFLRKYNAVGLAGIEIQATPPGKKIQSVAMLSGGERALTAIALICAIISANPSPFVVLDEVDAALDEANSERLAKILDDLSHKTQFIVITHNRASMRRASVLYGVTMGTDGVSQLLSVKLDEIKK